METKKHNEPIIIIDFNDNISYYENRKSTGLNKTLLSLMLSKTQHKSTTHNIKHCFYLDDYETIKTLDDNLKHKLIYNIIEYKNSLLQNEINILKSAIF